MSALNYDNYFLLKTDSNRVELMVDHSLILIHNKRVIHWLMGPQNLDVLKSETYTEALISSEKSRDINWAYIRNQFGFYGSYSIKLIYPARLYETLGNVLVQEIDAIMYETFGSLITSSLMKEILKLGIESNAQVLMKENRDKLEAAIKKDLRFKMLTEYGINLLSCTILGIKEEHPQSFRPKPEKKKKIDHKTMW
jgi:hypothetical protein